MVTAHPCRTHKREPRRGKDAGAQERAAADGRSVSGRPCEWNSSAAPVCSLASSMATKCELFHIGRLFFRPPFTDATGQRAN
jgi:hypothetical protein